MEKIIARIPKKFKVFNTTINVAFNNKQLQKQDTFGEADYKQNSITLCDEYRGEILPNDFIIDTFYHEKVHIILDAMREYELSQNEQFVEIFSRLLKQSDETSEF